MDSIPDAPWIIEAETWGVGYDEKPVWCPCCNAEDPERFYFTRRVAGGFRDVVGCSECIDDVPLEDAVELLPERGSAYDE